MSRGVDSKSGEMAPAIFLMALFCAAVGALAEQNRQEDSEKELAPFPAVNMITSTLSKQAAGAGLKFQWCSNFTYCYDGTQCCGKDTCCPNNKYCCRGGRYCCSYSGSEAPRSIVWLTAGTVTILLAKLWV